jgi:hypothetical protein
VRLGKAEEIMDGGDGTVNEGWGLDGEREVKRKLEFTADGSNAANDIGTVDGASIPGVSGAMDCFHEDLVGATIVACDSNAAVEHAKETLDAHGFVVATSSSVEFQFELFAHGFKEAAKSATGVHNNCIGEADLEEKLLHEDMGEIGGGDVREAFSDHHASKIAHGGEDVGGAVVEAGGVTGLPKIDMEDVKRAANGPRE